MLVLGSGFLGKQLINDYKAIGVSRSGKDGISADLRKQEDYKKLPSKQEIIVFTASPDSSSLESYKEVYQKAFNLSLAYAKSINSLKKFILISSTGVYGENNGEVVDEYTQAVPSRENAKVILEAERSLSNSELPYAILRFAGIYGPGRNRLIEKAKLGEIDLNTCAYSNRIHVQDCSRVVGHVLTEKSKHNLYIGVDSCPCDLREVSIWIREQLGLENNFELKNDIIKGKRCLNKRLLSEGFSFEYPSYKEGYEQIIGI